MRLYGNISDYHNYYLWEDIQTLVKGFLFINNWSHETCKITIFKENAWHSCYTSAIFILYVTSCRQSYACINEKMSHRVLDSVGHSWLIISCEIFATACKLLKIHKTNDHIF